MTDKPSVEIPPELRGSVTTALQRFLESYEPLRPDLYRYCRYLSRSPWDAEDLVQDTLARAFVSLGRMPQTPTSPRGWLFRIATNLWIDRTRRPHDELSPNDESAPDAQPDPRAAREAAGTLLEQLAPQERAAVVLKDVFDLTLEEIAATLSTTLGAIKSALHRGRGKLQEPALETARPYAAPPSAITAFCEAFNARDLDRLTATLLDNATVEIVGAATFHGAKAARDTALTGMLFGSKRLAAADKLGGVDPHYMQGVLPTLPRIEAREHRGEFLLLSWYEHTDGEFVRAITRVRSAGSQVSLIRNYFFTPEFIKEVCGELDVPCRVNGYRHCPPTDAGVQR